MIGSFSVVPRRSAAARAAVLALTVLIASPLGSLSADARAGSGFSFGSRGARTFSMPSFTTTAPRAAQPIQQSEAAQPNLGAPGLGANTQPRRFGFGGGLMAGLLGAGLFGLLGGGGLGGLLPLLLIGALVFMAFRFFRSRVAGPAFAGLGVVPNQRMAAGQSLGVGAPNAAPLAIGPGDFSAFERSLSDVQTAYGREDFNALAQVTTPEMLRVMGAQIEENRRRGQRNAVSDPRLLQGDLAESWREGSTDYATVAMRFSVLDTTVDRASGRLLSGDPARPTEATELWTFRRDRGGRWLLSAIQQAN